MTPRFRAFVTGTLVGILLTGLLALVPLIGGAATSVTALLDEADAVRSSDPTRFLELLGEIEKHEADATAEEKMRLRFLRTWRLSLSGKFDEAIAELRVLFDDATDVRMKFRAGAFIVNNYAATRQFAEGLTYLDQTLALLPKIDDIDLRQQGLVVAAVIYNQVGQYELARNYAEQVLAEPASSPRSRCMASYMRLEALFNLQALPRDDALFHDSIKRCVDQRELLVANYIRGHLARKWYAQGETARAIGLIDGSMAEIEATHYPRLVGEIQSLMAELKLADGHPTEAERYARLAIAQSGGVVYALPVVTAYRTLYEAALARGDAIGALENFRKYAEADKAYLNEVKAREIAFQLAKQESLQKTQTIELLAKQNEVLTLQQRVASQAAQNNRLIAALLAMLLASIAYWAFRIKREQVRFRTLAQTDALTGISNRHHYTRHAEAALARAQKSGQTVAIVMIDLDHFKAINDAHGHAAGDWALVRVAGILRSACGPNDAVGRLGGEEFALLLADTDAEAAARKAATCDAELRAIDSADTGRAFTVSASFGISDTTLSGHRFAALLADADEALYRSKDDGRGRISVFVPKAAPPLVATGNA